MSPSSWCLCIVNPAILFKKDFFWLEMFCMTCCWDCRQTPERNTTLTNSSSSDTFIGLIQNSHGLQININVQEKGSLQQEFALVGVHLGVEGGNLQNRERKTWMTTTSHVLIYSKLLTEGTSEWRGDAKTEGKKKKKKLFILCGQLRETGSQSVSYKRYERWRGSARACGRDRERESGGEGGGKCGGRKGGRGAPGYWVLEPP